MVQFTKLKLSGFKSFVDATEMEIGHGLTGIVGPNGCGKSNLVEALRWAMGETSPKRMRGSGMEDVIFNGTSSRPARNFAEVTLWLDNTDRKAPAELNHSDDLEIIRRIERDMGSNYKVNGKNVRARDVQLLFADSSIGANSPALVSQGRVADMINAKPTQRRLILEEAAGISGLHARRHEAELKLRAAEQNLTRLEDVLGTMESQLAGLKKQARQATRYRNLSGHIQKAEATLLHLRWEDAETKLKSAREAFDAAEAIVREKTMLVTSETTVQTEESAKLPELRKKEAEAAAALQRLRIAHNTLETEERKIAEEQEKAAQLLQQANADIEHEKNIEAEAGETIARLNAEAAQIEEAQSGQEEEREKALELKQKTYEIVEGLDADLNRLTQETAEREARRSSLSRQIEEAATRIEQLEEKLSSLREDHAELEGDTPETAMIREIEDKIEKLEKVYAETKTAFASAEEAEKAAEEAVQEASDDWQDKQKTHARLTAEAETLEKLLKAGVDTDYNPAIDALQVKSGFEKALAVALGDDLQAALDEAAPIHWRTLPELSADYALPGGIAPLSRHVDAPPALKRTLSQIGVVSTEQEAQTLSAELKPGQILVTPSGSAWRWDGLTVGANASDPAAVRLEQRNRLKDMEAEIAASENAVEKAKEIYDAAKQARVEAQQAEHDARDRMRVTEGELYELRDELASLNRAVADTTQKLAAMATSIETTAQEIERQSARKTEMEEELAALPGNEENRAAIEDIRARLVTHRDELTEHQAQYNQVVRDAEARRNRLDGIVREIENWESRRARTGSRLEELALRIENAQNTLESLKSRPGEIAAEKQELLSKIAEAEELRNAAADELAETENKAGEAQRQLRETENALSDAKEARALAQASVTTAQHTRDSVTAQIREKFNCEAEDLLAKVGIDPETTDLPEEEAIANKLERLIRERENMGPVNLRAEVEAEEITEEMDNMQAEHDDLVAAINRLRHGIGRLNSEARERLLKAFDTVNEHFQDLFTRLFAGGRAHLELTDADDPLEAGLEIYAQPPGKKLQVLSLLSGGEQTLTSIALIFGMFLTNPAPICVLDEIDAPLDESNVDRVCTLLEEMAKDGSTRFIIITHHRMTMARMDRLYGVTMSENGVSQLVSVDLRQQDLLDAAAAE